MKILRALLAFPLILAVPLAEAEESGNAPAAEAQEVVFSEAELEQLLAPIALYPDVLLAQILIAATYPLEIVQAQRWVKAHSELEGEEAVEAAAEQDWDPSVAALTAFPAILQRMDGDLAWTQRLGDAFLLQEADVMNTVQSLRDRALAAGQLQSTEQLSVQREESTIVIEPADPQIIYVPYYSTRVVYGDWRWADYPPVYWTPPAGYLYPTVGFSWGSGTRFSTSFGYSTFHWPHRHVVIVDRAYPFHYKHHRHRFGDCQRWHHDPYHRRGVGYRDGYYDRHKYYPPHEGWRGDHDRALDREQRRALARAEHSDRARDARAIRQRMQARHERALEQRRAEARAEQSDRVHDPVAVRERMQARHEQRQVEQRRAEARAEQRNREHDARAVREQMQARHEQRQLEQRRATARAEQRNRFHDARAVREQMQTRHEQRQYGQQRAAARAEQRNRSHDPQAVRRQMQARHASSRE